MTQRGPRDVIETKNSNKNARSNVCDKEIDFEVIYGNIR
jgi:hypothetical protein